MKIIINYPRNLRRLKTWAELPDYNEDGVDQFEYIKVYQLDETGKYIGDMSANNIGATLSHADVVKIADMQIEDEFTVSQKMAWCTFGDQPRWGGVMRVMEDYTWQNSPQVRIVGCVYAGNLVEVLETRTFPNVLYDNVRADVPMIRIRTFTDADWGKTFASDPHLIHSVHAVGRDDIEHKPKGNVYLPLIFPHDSVWVFDRWLV